jgi:hypothetical protein
MAEFVRRNIYIASRPHPPRDREHELNRGHKLISPIALKAGKTGKKQATSDVPRGGSRLLPQREQRSQSPSRREQLRKRELKRLLGEASDQS